MILSHFVVPEERSACLSLEPQLTTIKSKMCSPPAYGTETSKPHVVMQMWKPYRESLVRQHRFYVNEASTRLMSQFDNINADADNRRPQQDLSHPLR
jgi:hypothetical protein